VIPPAPDCGTHPIIPTLAPATVGDEEVDQVMNEHDEPLTQTRGVFNQAPEVCNLVYYVNG
jgi:hypothetical protein